MNETVQRNRVSIVFETDSPVFPDDPDDIYELAAIEAESIQSLISNLNLDVEGTLKVEVLPVL